MATEENNRVMRRFVNLCHLFMGELGMPEAALQELLNRAHATTTTELEGFKSVMHWASLTAKVYDVGAEIATGPYNPNFKTPDLNQPAPQDDDDDDEGPSEELVIMQDHGKMVEAGPSTTTRKRNTTQANHSMVKRSKFTQETAGPSTRDKGKGILEVEGWGEN